MDRGEHGIAKTRPPFSNGTRSYWYTNASATVRARDLCYSIGLKPPRGGSMQIPAWAVVIGRVATPGAIARTGVRGALRNAAKVCAADPVAADALCAAERLGGLPAALKTAKQLGEPERSAEQEVLDRLAEKERVRKRRADYARRMLLEHQRKLAREERLVKKWAAKVRRYEKEGF